MHSNAPLKLVVSIINFRTGDLTLSCIQSALEALGDTSARIVVVDNRSNDGSADEIERWIAAQNPTVPVTLIRSATNSGFSGGHNQGINALEAEYYLVLNSDAAIRSGFFDALFSAAETNPEAGLFAPCIEYKDGTQQVSCFRFPSPASELIRGAKSGPVTRLLKAHEVALSMPPAPDQIDWASFACILLRGSMIAEIGPMDEGYFLYFEDAEYCWRARKAGWKIVHVPEARAVHFRGGSGPVKALQQEKKRLPAYYYASRARFLYQAYGWTGVITANTLWSLGRGLAQMRRLAGKSVPPANQREALDIWTNIQSPLGNNRAPAGD